MLASLVQRVLDDLIDSAAPELTRLSRDLEPVIGHARRFTGGGKRLRASFCAAGARIADGRPGTALSTGDAVVLAASSLELFHAAALVHDDIIDRSDTRRGALSTHRALEAHHAASGWAGDGERFGVSAAILAGDLLLTWSDDLFVEAQTAAATSERARRARREFSRMRAEVTAGQYMDLVEELAWPVVPVAERADRAIAIATSKAARYSVEAPLVIGALLGGADDELVARIRAFGLPLGLAFQLRDDVLGVYGDESVTGKPAGDDLREGKRTLLIAETERRVDDAERARLDALLGDAAMPDEEIARIQRLMRESGGLDAVETTISALLDQALAALERVELDAEARALLEGLAHRAARRDA